MVKKIIFIASVFIALGTKAQELVNSSNVATFTTAGQGDLYVDENDVYYLGLDDGSLKEIGVVTERGGSTGDVLAWNDTTEQWESYVLAAVATISSPITLDHTHRTIILTNNSSITLPSAATSEGREYIIKKTNDGSSTISSYLDEKGISRTTINRGTFTFISDGSNWQLLNSKTIDSYSGSFAITSTGSLSIAGIPFRPSRIEFRAYANVDATTLNADNGVGNNNTGINNSFGYMAGFAQTFNGTTTQQVICGGGSGNSINDISRYASSSQCIGIRYGNQNGDNLGLTTASLTSFNDNGFTLNVLSNADDVVVVYTAYR